MLRGCQEAIKKAKEIKASERVLIPLNLFPPPSADAGEWDYSGSPLRPCLHQRRAPENRESPRLQPAFKAERSRGWCRAEPHVLGLFSCWCPSTAPLNAPAPNQSRKPHQGAVGPPKGCVLQTHPKSQGDSLSSSPLSSSREALMCFQLVWLPSEPALSPTSPPHTYCISSSHLCWQSSKDRSQ